MTDSEEETVYLNVVFLFVFFALKAYQMCAFYAVFAVKSERIGVVKYLNVFFFLYSLAHYFGCTEVGLAHNHVDLLCQT